MVTLLYKRLNMIEEVIADLFGGPPQGTVSDIVSQVHPARSLRLLTSSGLTRRKRSR